jgi:hypothetical protein
MRAADFSGDVNAHGNRQPPGYSDVGVAAFDHFTGNAFTE